MSPPRPGRLALWSGIGLVLLFAGLSVYDYVALHHGPSRYVANESLVEELSHLPLAQESETAAGEDWPQWRGPRRDGVSRETRVLTAWPLEGLRVLWSASCGDGYSSLAVARGLVYTFGREGEFEMVYCWSAVTGEEVWHHAYPAPCDLPYGSGPRSTPAVDGDRVYTVGASGIFHCLHAATGEILWRRDLRDEYDAVNLTWGTSFSPLVEGDLVLTNPGGSKGNSIVALNKHTGAHVWSALDDRASYSSPIATTAAGVRQIVFLTGDALVGLEPQHGRLLWRYPWNTHDGINVATPIAVDDYLFVSSGYEKGCALLKVLRDGPSLRVERVYETRAMSNHFSTSVLYGENLYGFVDAGLLTCMRFRTGKVLWKQRGFGKGSLIAVNGHLIVLAEGGGRIAFVEATGDGYREKGRCPIPDVRCWSMPALAHGRLFVRTRTETICFDVRALAPTK